MGKRKLHAQTYFQCDWTGLPMRQTNCFMPTWNEEGKLVKHGSYTCWESVVAHAEELHKTGEITDWLLSKVKQYIDNAVGQTVHAAPHWSTLAWFAREETDVRITSPEDFIRVCSSNSSPVTAVHMASDGSMCEVVCTQDEVDAKFVKYLNRPFLHNADPQSFQTVRKKGVKDRDLTVFYWPLKNGQPFNSSASTMFKMQIYGDVLLVQQTKEPCFLPRERYVNYTLTMYQDQFSNKRSRKEPTSLTTEDYAIAKAEMASELKQVESEASAFASVPADLAKASILEPPAAQELAKLLRARGQSPPHKRPKMQALETQAVVSVEA